MCGGGDYDVGRTQVLRLIWRCLPTDTHPPSLIKAGVLRGRHGNSDPPASHPSPALISCSILHDAPQSVNLEPSPRGEIRRIEVEAAGRRKKMDPLLCDLNVFPGAGEAATMFHHHRLQFASLLTDTITSIMHWCAQTHTGNTHREHRVQKHRLGGKTSSGPRSSVRKAGVLDQR